VDNAFISKQMEKAGMKKATMALLGVLLAVTLLATGCPAAQAKEGDTVRVHYTLTLKDGTVADSSMGGEPLEFTIGDGSVIQGFDEAVNGMRVGESKTVTIPPEKGYPYREDYILIISRDQLPEGLEPVVGQQLVMQLPNGGAVSVTIVSFDETTVTVDANHSLAGEELIFELELVEIVPGD
jgi:peptidylprolyl isomerase